MRYLLTLALLGLIVAGCSSRPGTSQPAATEAPSNPHIANVAPEGKLTEAAPANTTASLPAVTAAPSAIVLTPVQGSSPVPPSTGFPSTENWKTFTSAALDVSVSYPPNWSVAEEGGVATFTAPNGATIQLKQNTAEANSKEVKTPNQYCTSRTNQYGQTADVCADDASFTFTANFTLQKADGSAQRITLLTKTRSVGDIFLAMFNSLQPVK